MWCGASVDSVFVYIFGVTFYLSCLKFVFALVVGYPSFSMKNILHHSKDRGDKCMFYWKNNIK